MRESWTDAVAFVLSSEGGYVNDPRDPGGETFMGITAATLEKAERAKILPPGMTVRDLTRPDVERIYRAFYWDPIGGDALPRPLDIVAMDTVVNGGPGMLARCVQRCDKSLAQDGQWGPKSAAALARLSPESLLNAREADYRALCKKNRAFDRTFKRGWLARVERLRAYIATR